MISMSFIIVILTVLSTIYAIPYANYEFKNHLKFNTI